MQKGKAVASPPAMILQNRAPQQNARGPLPSQQRSDDFNPRQAQPYQIPPGQMHQNLFTQQMPGPPQGQPRLPNQQPFYPNQRPMRIPRHQPPNNQPMYSSPPGGPPMAVQMIGHPGTTQFIPPGQHPSFITQPVDFSLPMGSPAQMQYHRPQQPMQGQFAPVSGPSQPQGSPYFQPTAVYQVGQPTPPMYIVRAPPGPMTGMPQYQTQTFEPRTRERKIIQIKDPNSNKDVTQEILNQRPPGSLTGSTGGTPNNITPDISGQSSSSSTPPLTLQQQAEANVRAQFAAQVAATLVNSEDKPKKPEVIHKAPVSNKAVVDTVQLKETTVTQKNELEKETRTNPTIGIDTQVAEKPVEKPLETQPKEVHVKMQPKEAAQGSKLSEGVSGDIALGPKSLVSSVDATTSAKGIIPNVRVEIFTADEVRKKEAQQISLAAAGEVKPERKEKSEETAQEPVSDVMPVAETKILNGPVAVTNEETDKTEEVVTVESQSVVDMPPVQANVAETTEPTESAVEVPVDQQVSETEVSAQPTDESEDLPTASKVEDVVASEKVNGLDGDSKTATTAPKNTVDAQATVAAKDMKKKKQKHRLKEIEKRSSEKGMDLMEAYTEKPVQEEVPGETEGPAAEETTQTPQEEAGEEDQSEEETWEDKEESWSPELDGETEPSRPEGGKLTYERDFLLQFQSNPLCQIKPEGLPDLEVVLGQARTPSKSGFSQNRMQKSDGGENMFLPSFMRQQSRNNQSGSRGGRKMNTQPKKVIDFPSVQPQVELKRTENRWVRQGEISKTGSEDEQKTEELFRKVRSILNKLTPQKFQTLTQQIIDLDIDTPERLEGAIDLIFEKAIDEAAFSVAYANMCRCLVPKKVVVEKEGVKKDISFRKILLNRCQKEFEKEKSVEKRIHEKLEHLSKEGLTEEELEAKKKELLNEEHLAKRRTLGNIRFIGELFKLKMLTESIMHDCVVKLLKSNDEESFECMCKLLFTIGKDLDHAKAKQRVDQYFTQINKIIKARITSSRVRFMMQDVVDLRNNDWVPRREDNNPKTIDQIHKEAADEAKKAQLKIQMDKQQEKKMPRGNMGGRDSPRPSIPQADETWTTVGRGPRSVNVSVDPKKFQNIKRPVDSENISLGPGGRGYGAWARGSSGGSGAAGAGAGPSTSAVAASDADNRPANRYSALAGERKHSAPAKVSVGEPRRQEPRSPVSGGRRQGPVSTQEREKALEAVRAVTQPKLNIQERDGGRESPRTPESDPSTEAAVVGSAVAAPVQELTEEDMKKKSIAIIDEYLNIKDMSEVAVCLKEVRSPAVHYVFVDEILNHTMEKKASDRNASGKLLHFLLRDGVLTAQQYLQGLEQFLEFAEDIEIDIPQLWNYLGELLGPTAFDGNIDLSELFKCILKYVSKHKAAKLFAYMLQTATNDTSPEDVSAILNRYDVSVYTFFEKEAEAKQFAKDQNIEFALGQGKSSLNPGSPNQHSARIQEELRTLILKRKARNDEVFNWIDRNVSSEDAKASPFIRALVTAVCEGAMEKEDGGVCKCNINTLKERKPLLQKYIDDNASLEIQAVYAVQALFVQLDHPPSFVKSYFDSLYDEEIITEDSFKAWENSSDQEPGKGVTVTAASEFFRWLKSAPEETGEES